MQPIDWNDLRHVLAVGRAGHFVGAGRLLRVDGTTVARRLAAIETALGARLFDRIAGGGLRPTPAGEAALARAERIEQEVGGLQRTVDGTDVAEAGTVRITAVPILANRVLVPAAAAFTCRHPALRLEIIADPRNLSLTKREADLALRFALPDAGARTVARRLARLSHGAYGPAVGPPDLPWVTYEEGMAALAPARWMAKAMAAEGIGAAPIAINDAEGALQAVRAGIGRSCLPTIVGDVADGLQRRPSPPGLAPLVRDLWLLAHPDVRRLGRIQAVVAWLDEIFGGKPASTKDR